MKLPTVLVQSRWHPPFSVAHSSISVQVLAHVLNNVSEYIHGNLCGSSLRSQKLFHSKIIEQGSTIYLPTQLRPSSKSEYPFIQEQKYPPTVLLHSWLQPETPSSHSLISVGYVRIITYVLFVLWLIHITVC